MITASVDFSRMLKKIEKIQPLTNKSVKELVDQQVKLFISDPRGKTGMVQLTPPSNSDAQGTAGKKQGEGAVARDIMKVYTSAPQVYLDIAGTNEAAAKGFYMEMLKGNYAEAERIMRSSGTRLRNIEVGRFNKSFHEKSRRRGIVHRHRPAQVVTNWKALTSYIRKKQKSVGLLASGWIGAASRFKASVPAWIRRHGTKNSAPPKIKETATIYQVTLASNAGFDQARTQYRARYALKYRMNAMRKQAPYLLRAAIRKATKGNK